MAVETKVKIQDTMTGTLMKMIDSIDMIISALETMQRASSIDTSGLDRTAESANKAYESMSKLDNMQVSPKVILPDESSLADKTITVNADTSQAVANMRNMQSQSHEVNVTANTESAQESIEKLAETENALHDTNINVMQTGAHDASQAITGVSDSIDQLNANSINVDTSQAMNHINNVSKAVDQLNAKTGSASISTASDMSGVTSANRAMSAVGNKTVTITADTSQANEAIEKLSQNESSLADKTITVNADTSQAVDNTSKLNESLSEVQDINPHINVTDAFAQARENLASAMSELMSNMKIPEQEEPIKPTYPDHIPQPDLPPVHQQIEWDVPKNIQVFTNTGIDRFKSELNDAKRLMAQLNEQQKDIGIEANKTDLIPDTMKNDIASVDTKIQQMAEHLGEISGKSFAHLGLDNANVQLETLRGSFQEIINLQATFKKSMSDLNANAAEASYTQLNNIINSTEHQIRDNIRAQNDMTSSVDKTASSAEKLSSGFSGIGRTILGLSAVQTVLGMVKGQMDSAIGRMDTMSNYQRTMTAITKDTNTASKSLDQLKSATKGTAYGLDTAAQATQNFVTRGLDVNQSVSLVAAWMDAVSFYGEGTNEQLSNVTDALGKMLTKGTVEMDQLDRLTDAGINAVGIYAQATGQSTADVQAALSKGKISAQQFVGTVTASMEKGGKGIISVADAAKKSGTTWAASIDNMKAALTRGIVSMIDSINSALTSNGLPTLLQMIQQFGSTAETVLTDIGSALGTVITVMSPILNFIGSAGKFIADNWSVIAPIVLTAAAALSSYMIILTAYKAVMAVINGVHAIYAAVVSVVCARYYMLAGATVAETAAQYGLNTALLACPITWIVLAFIAFIGVIYIAVAAINNFTGSSLSATGIIVGSVSALGAIVINIVLGIYNLALDVIEGVVNGVILLVSSIKALISGLASVIYNIGAAIYNFWAMVTEKMLNAWNSFVTKTENIVGSFGVRVISVFEAIVNGATSAANSFANTFIGAANYAIGGINKVIGALNKLPMVDIPTADTFGSVDLSIDTSGIDAAQSKMQELANAQSQDISINKMDYKNPVEDMANNFDTSNLVDMSSYKAKYKSVSDAYQNGYDFGKSGADKLKNMINPSSKMKSAKDNLQQYKPDTNALNNLANTNKNTGNTAKNTKNIDKNLADSSEDLKYLRDIASRDIINKFTTAAITVNMTNNNKVNSKLDIDGITKHFRTKIEEEMNKAAKGVY